MRPLTSIVLLLVILGFSLWAFFRLIDLTFQKEGFATSPGEDVENPLTPQQFSYELLRGVMGPIRRLSKELVNMDNWRERWALAQMNPTELARHQLKAAK